MNHLRQDAAVCLPDVREGAWLCGHRHPGAGHGHRCEDSHVPALPTNCCCDRSGDVAASWSACTAATRTVPDSYQLFSYPTYADVRANGTFESVMAQTLHHGRLARWGTAPVACSLLSCPPITSRR